jgi:ribosome-associated protein
VLDLRGISSFTDFFVICSGTSEPQLKAITNEIETRLREDHALRPAAIDGFPASQWMVLDYLQVVVHIFHSDKRAFYSLEDLWGDAPRVGWEAAAASRGGSSSPKTMA